MRPPERRIFSLNLPPWAGGPHGFSCLDRRRSRNAQVIGGCPEPNRAWVRGIRRERNQDVSLPRGIHVVGSLIALANQRDVLAHERIRNLPNSYPAGELEIERKSMAVEDGRLHHLQG